MGVATGWIAAQDARQYAHQLSRRRGPERVLVVISSLWPDPLETDAEEFLKRIALACAEVERWENAARANRDEAVLGSRDMPVDPGARSKAAARMIAHVLSTSGCRLEIRDGGRISVARSTDMPTLEFFSTRESGYHVREVQKAVEAELTRFDCDLALTRTDPPRIAIAPKPAPAKAAAAA